MEREQTKPGARPYDNMLRRLVRADPQTFVDLVFPGARYLKMLHERSATWAIEVDSAILVTIDNKEVIVNLEIQAYSDVDMATRLIEYNVVLKHDYKRPVVSRVMYLLTGRGSIDSPWCWDAVCGNGCSEEVMYFYFKYYEVPTMVPDDILSRNKPVLYPLVPLTKGGATRSVVEWMLTTLVAHHDADIALAGYTLAAKVFERNGQFSDLEWIRRRYNYMHDIMRESPVYNWIMEEGQVDILRKAIVSIVGVRFPTLVPLVQNQIIEVDDLTILFELNVKMGTVNDIEEARKILYSIQQ